MFCPQCGTSQNDELRFCKQCGANLHAVRQVVNSKEANERFDWSKTWVAEMFLTHAEQEKRAEDLERQRGITPEVKRYKEIKVGVMTSFIGIAVMIVLFVVSQGLIASGFIPANVAEIIKSVWIAGVVPFLVGLALLVNGVVVSKRLVELANRQLQQSAGPSQLKSGGKTKEDLALPPSPQYADPSTPEFSVTDSTTRRLSDSENVL